MSKLIDSKAMDKKENEVIKPTEETEESHQDLEETMAEAAGQDAGQTAEPAPTPQPEAPRGNVFQRFKRWYGSNKKLSIPLTVVAVLAVLLAIPYTRYLVVGTVWRQNFTVKVLDRETGTPVSSATVRINGKTASTDGQGRATLRLNAGKAKLHLEKKYYQSSDTDVLVPILKQKQPAQVKFKATGRQVTVTLVNKINRKPVAEVTVSFLDTKAKTDKEGHATLVVPADKQKVEVTVESKGYNKTKADVRVTTDEKANTVAVTPAGQIYFLSNASGKLDVVKTNLDGTGRKTVLAGTGKEAKNNTTLLATRDWKYLALLSHRDDSKYDKLYLIDTTSGDAVTTMDEGNAYFALNGWSDHRFIFTVTRDGKPNYESNFAALKSFDAPSKKLVTLDQYSGEGNASSTLFAGPGSVFILKDEVVYAKIWQGYGYPASETLKNKKSELRSVHADGSNNHVVANYGYYLPPNTISTSVIELNARLYEPQGIWIKATAEKTEEYEDGSVKSIKNISYDEFYNADYPTYLISPDGNKTFWQKSTDGKNILSVGDSNGDNAKQISKAAPYNVYGWYTDDYLLVTKDSSELYVMPVGGGDAQKVTDYYKAPAKYSGYGSGYGGL